MQDSGFGRPNLRYSAEEDNDDDSDADGDGGDDDDYDVDGDGDVVSKAKWAAVAAWKSRMRTSRVG